MNSLKSLLVLIIIPIIGIFIAEAILLDINTDIEAAGIQMSATQLCSSNIASEISDIRSMCNQTIEPIILMKQTSIISIIVSVILILSYTLLSRISGQNRKTISRVFPMLVFLTILILSIQVLVQGVILTYGAYIGESWAIGRVHIFLIGGIGVGAFIGSLMLIASLFQYINRKPLNMIGQALDLENGKDIFNLVNDIAETLGSKKPKNITIGLEPNFYVTSTKVNVIGDKKPLKGETLFLSLPLMRILTLDELKSVIGHELGHFRGEDTVYSLKFAPVYSGLTNAIQSLSSLGQSSAGIASLPAYIVLSNMIDSFHKNVSVINREREYEADKASSEIVDSKALASALLKISLYASYWQDLEDTLIERMRKGKFTRNLSLIFSSVVKNDVDENKIGEVIEIVSKNTISHPTDSHPSTVSRIEALNVDIRTIDKDVLKIPASSSIDILNNVNNLEEELTLLQQQYYHAKGIKIPDEEESSFATIIAAFAAHMVLADDKIESEEINTAENIGIQLIEEFDYIQFREYCHYPDSIPTLEDLLRICEDISDEAKKLIFDYMLAISEADNDIDEKESKLLDLMKSSFKIE